MQTDTDEIFAIANEYVEYTGDEDHEVTKTQLRVLLDTYKEEVGARKYNISDTRLVREFKKKFKEIYGVDLPYINKRTTHPITGKNIWVRSFKGIRIRETPVPSEEESKLSLVDNEYQEDPPF
jgi:hypothetical protein